MKNTIIFNQPFNFNCLVLILIISMLSGCSDYPTSGKLNTNTSNMSFKGEQVTFNDYEGYVVEVDLKVLEDIKSITKVSNDYYKNQKSANVLDFNVAKKISLIDTQPIDILINEFEQQMSARQDKIKNVVNNWKKIKDNELRLAQKSYEIVLKQKEKFDEYTKKESLLLNVLLDKKEELINKEKQIWIEIANKTNSLITNNEIPLNAQKFKIEYNKEIYVAHKNNCKSNDHKIYISMDKALNCLFIIRPINNISSKEYDNYIQNQASIINNLNFKELDKDIYKAKNNLVGITNKANESLGISYSGIDNEVNSASKKIVQINKAIEAASFENMSHASYKRVQDLEPNLQKILYDSFNEGINELAIDVFNIEPSYVDIYESHEKKIASYINNELYNLKKESINKNIKNISKIESNGDFSGLNGSFGLLILLANINATVDYGNESIPSNYYYSELLNIVDKNNKFVKSGNFDIVVNKDNVKWKKIKKEINKDNIPVKVSILIGNYLKRKL